MERGSVSLCACAFGVDAGDDGVCAVIFIFRVLRAPDRAVVRVCVVCIGSTCV